MNPETGRQEKTLNPLPEEQVAEYLEEHPEFFDHQPELLSKLRIPHESGRAISLIERQVELLRRQLNEHQHRLDELVRVARENDALHLRMHRLTLQLIDAGTFDEVLNALQDELHDGFRADAVELRLFSASQLEDHLEADAAAPQSKIFQTFFSQSKPICGKMPKEQFCYIFGAEGEEIASAALIPLRSPGVLGMLAIGSRDPQRFTPNQSTDFLTQLGEIISRTLQAVSLPGI